MANLFLRSADGSDTDGGTTWALAKATIAGIEGVDSAADHIFVADAHAESTASSISIDIAGTPASPSWILCVDDTADPASPTTLATTGTISTTAASNITIDGSFYCYGLKFTSGSTASSTSLTFFTDTADATQVYEQCDFILGNSNALGRITFTGVQAETHCEWRNCDVKFGNTSQGITHNGGYFKWSGGSVLSGGSSPSTLFIATFGSRPGSIYIEGVDFSNLNSSVIFFTAAPQTHDPVVMRNCRLPASWPTLTGTLVTGTINAPGNRYEMYNCDGADTNYRLWIQDYAGTIKSETTIVRTGGASDGTTPIAWRMDSGSNVEYPVISLVSPEMVKWSDTIGAKTVTVEFVHDSGGAGTAGDFQNDEIWLEVQYLGTDTRPLGTFISSAKVMLGTAADYTNSSETWTTTGLTTPVKQKLSVSFTTAEKGFIHAKVYLGKASKSVYVDPEMTVS
jgi:hypothetical protein